MNSFIIGLSFLSIKLAFLRISNSSNIKSKAGLWYFLNCKFWTIETTAGKTLINDMENKAIIGMISLGLFILVQKDYNKYYKRKNPITSNAILGKLVSII